MSKHYQTADAQNREELPPKQQMKPQEFIDLWMNIIDRRFKMNLAPREWHVLGHWKPEEIHAAFEATAKSNRPSWAYLKAVLEGQARGETEKPMKRGGIKPPSAAPAKPPPIWSPKHDAFMDDCPACAGAGGDPSCSCGGEGLVRAVQHG